jgi:hypothetical protein
MPCNMLMRKQNHKIDKILPMADLREKEMEIVPNFFEKRTNKKLIWEDERTQ